MNELRIKYKWNIAKLKTVQLMLRLPLSISFFFFYFQTEPLQSLIFIHFMTFYRNENELSLCLRLNEKSFLWSKKQYMKINSEKFIFS